MQLPFLGEPVAQNNGVVNGQSQLEHHGDGVGHKGNLPHQVVGAHVQERRRTEGQQKHGHLQISFGGEQQYAHDNAHRNQHDNFHFAGQRVLKARAHLAVDVEVAALQHGPDLVHSVLADLVLHLTLQGEGEQCGGIGVGIGQNSRLVLRVVELHSGHPLHRLQRFLQLQSAVQRDVGHHDAGTGIGDEFVPHDGQALTGLGVRGQVGR